MLVKTYGSAVSGIDAKTITIEVDITRGIKFLYSHLKIQSKLWQKRK